MVIAEDKAKRKITIGIVMCAILVIEYSFFGMPIGGFNVYYSKFRPSPENLIFLRYLFSIFQRLVLLISGIGILFRRDIFRKITIFASFFIISTVYWKHPVACYRKILWWKIIDKTLPVDIITRINMLAWVCVAISTIIDVSICLCLIYYLTRANIKEQFK